MILSNVEVLEHNMASFNARRSTFSVLSQNLDKSIWLTDSGSLKKNICLTISPPSASSALQRKLSWISRLSKVDVGEESPLSHCHNLAVISRSQNESFLFYSELN